MIICLSPNQIKYMVDRFLMWKLPPNFAPDGGISFKATFNEHTEWPMKNEPVGTNLFDANQAEAMVRYMIDGLALPDVPFDELERLYEATHGKEHLSPEKVAWRRALTEHLPALLRLAREAEGLRRERDDALAVNNEQSRRHEADVVDAKTYIDELLRLLAAAQGDAMTPTDKPAHGSAL